MTDVPTKTIYDLALHETLEMGKLRATRVPGGWWYREGEVSGIFIPYSPEFKFSTREEKRRDALEELRDMEHGR